MLTSDGIETTLRTRAEEDQAFRARLIEDPKGAIEEAVGVKIPGEITVTVHAETPNDFHLVLPPTPGGRMSGEELREASGGWGAGGAW